MNKEVRTRIERNVALVEHIVTRMSARLPNHYERDDLVQAGMLALVESAGRFDEDRGVAFSTFAGRRIEGAILDVIRRDDWLPRSARAKARELAAVEQELLDLLGVRLFTIYQSVDNGKEILASIMVSTKSSVATRITRNCCVLSLSSQQAFSSVSTETAEVCPCRPGPAVPFCFRV